MNNPSTEGHVHDIGKTRSLIRETLARLIAGSQNPSDVAYVVEDAHRIAVAYLRAASFSTQELLSRLGLSANDAALDSVADLFVRDEADTFVVLVRWWQALQPVARAKEEQVTFAFRRLVIGAVHQRVFQLYRDNDPTLGRILRNIKLALKLHPDAIRTEHAGELELSPRGCDDLLRDLPPMPPEILLPEFYELLPLRAKLKSMLAVMAGILRNQRTYRRTMPRMQAALIVRDAFLSDVQWQKEERRDEGLTEEEIHTIIVKTLGGAPCDILQSYVRRKQLTATEAQAYSKALLDIFRPGPDFDGDSEKSYFEILRKHHLDLTKKEYRERHRVMLEYLARTAKHELRRRFLEAR